jgi:hypothetical protein
MVRLRVANPTAIAVHAVPVAAEPLLYPTFAEDAQRVVLAPTGSVRLEALLTEGEGAILAGRWTPDVTHGPAILVVPEGRLTVSDTAFLPVQLLAVLALEEGADLIQLRGPMGMLRQVGVEVTATPALVSLELCAGGSTAETFEKGTQTALTATGRTADDAPAFGFPVTLFSSDPRVVTVEHTDPDAATLRFAQTGQATITAILDADPTVRASLVLTVVPAE